MKKTLLTLTVASIHVAAFAQGKVTFNNGPNHLVVFGSGVVGQYAPYAGLPVPQIPNPAGMGNFTAQLWGGTSAGSLTLQSTLTPAGLEGLADGRLVSQGVTLTGILSGEPAFFQILIWETAYGSYANAATLGRPVGLTPVFQASTGSFAPTPLDSSPGWVAAPIVVGIPEPSTYVLVGLGVALLLVFRRRR